MPSLAGVWMLGRVACRGGGGGRGVRWVFGVEENVACRGWRTEGKWVEAQVVGGLQRGAVKLQSVGLTLGALSDPCCFRF